MDLRDEIKPYIDENGLVLPKKNSPGSPETGNGLLYTSIYYTFLVKLKQFQKGDELDFARLVLSCQVDTNAGLYHRAPDKTEEQIAWDDYIGVISAASIIGCHGLLNMRRQAERRYLGVLRFCFPNLNPEKLSPLKAWFGRNPWFTGFAKVCLNMNYTGFAEFFLSLRFLWSGLFINKENIILNWLMANAVKSRSIIVDDSIEFLRRRIIRSKRWSLTTALIHEFGVDHPLTKAAMEYEIGKPNEVF